MQTSLAVKKHLRKEREWKGNRKRKKGRKELGDLHQDSIQCVQLKESLGLVTGRERGLDTQADTLHAMVICSGRDRSPVKGLKMCLLGLLLGLSGLEPQPRVFQKSLCPDVGAESKKDT